MRLLSSILKALRPGAKPAPPPKVAGVFAPPYAPAGWWHDDPAEQLRNYRSWVYAAVNAIEPSEALAAKTGAWSIVMGSDATLEGAQFEATQARKHGYTPAVIYQQEQWFVTTVGNYPNQEAAMSDTIAVRSKLRSSAFPVNVKGWWANPVDEGGYVACGAK